MLRWLVLGTVALTLLGCKGGGKVVDPFVGRTRVEPPRTGSVTGQAGDPYYAPSGRTTTPWTPTAPGTTPVAPQSNLGAPAGGWVPASGAIQNNNSARSPAFEPNRSSSTVGVPDPVAASPAPSREPVVRIIEPRSVPPAATPMAEPRPLDSQSVASASPIAASAPGAGSGPSVDLASLAGAGSGTAGQPSTGGAGPVQLASATAPIAAAASCACQAAPASATPQPTPSPAATQGDYGYDPQYQWLRGLLDYSQAERCWRLRYIPAGSPADALGGSVILCNPASLSGFERGQMVEVRGRLVQKNNGRCAATVYEVSEIRRTAG